MTTITNRSLIQFVAAIAVVAVGCVGFVSTALAQDESIELRELRAALSVVQKQAAEADARAQKSERQRKELVKSLAEAVRVSDEQMVASREVQLKLQAFGVDLFTMEENSLERRLLKAVRDLDIAHQEKEMQARILQKLSDSFAKYLEQSSDMPEEARAQGREAIQEALRAIALANDTGKNGGNGKSGLDNSRVVSIDSEIGLIVLNMGRSKGVKVGTPVAVLRNDRPVFTAMIVDVRDSICGAVLQDKIADNGEVKVGDSIRLLPSGSN